MTSSELDSATIIKQRKRFEALGTAINKADGMASWLKVLLAITLIFGLPTIVLLSDPAKDSTIVMYEMIIFASRVLIITMVLYITSKITREIYTASNDYDKKTQEIGFKEANTNTIEERKLITNNVMYTIISIVVILSSFIGIFLVGSRYIETYITGQLVVYITIIVCLGFSFKFWSGRNSDESPRMGGRKLIQILMPVFMFLSIEIIIDFFGILSEPRFRVNALLLSWGIIYPFLFLFLVIAILITTKKTPREKIGLQEAKIADFQRKETHIQDKNKIKQAFFRMKVSWNKFSKKLIPRDPTKKKNLDRKPSKALVQSLWITLFITVVPFALIAPWSLFPHDGLLFIAALMISYQYSMIKYERYEIDVIAESAKDESIQPTEMRKPSFIKNALIMLLLPTVIFITIQYLISGVIIGEILTVSTEMVVIGFTWVTALIVLPISYQLFLKIKANTDIDRSENNVLMFRTGLLYIFFIELILIACSIGSHFFVSIFVDYEFIQWAAMGLQLAFVGALIVLPIIFLYIVPKLSDKGYKTAKIVTISIISIINVAILVLFIVDIIVGFFL
ncbi:MAG: hypothetical protein KGD64_02625 [Candidatus Heimdallarchaeota archaeon]|nr:hypothetical protein [Candidatus Heimdallarchaeota archaeon]